MILGHESQITHLTQMARAGVLPHAMLFAGQDGLGKRTVAAALARFVETGEFATSGTSTLSDVMFLAPDEGSIGIDRVREAKQFLYHAPYHSPHRLLIIDDAHLMTDEAQDALLKLAEESPSYAHSILICPDAEMLHTTLASRLQHMLFSPVATPKIAAWLQDLGLPRATAEDISSRAFGRPGLAWRLGYDKSFQKNYEYAGQFLKLSDSARRAATKALVAEDSFQFQPFLDMLILHMAPDANSNRRRWHDMMRLRQDAARLNLNPRIQLEALLSRDL